MNSLTVLKHPQPQCCSTCSEWLLAAYCSHPRGIKDNEPYCRVLGISLESYLVQHGGTRLACGGWRQEMIETSAVETYDRLVALNR